MNLKRIEKYTKAIVREIPDSYENCSLLFRERTKIDLYLARKQHKEYCSILSELGLSVIKIPKDDNLPDCCFTEDTALILKEMAIITYPGTKSRINEIIEVEKILRGYKNIEHINPPANIEGGDVLIIENIIYVGCSTRTNKLGINQLEEIVMPYGYKVIPIKIKNVLHLKTACSYIGNGNLLLVKGYFDDNVFNNLNKIIIPYEEKNSANVLRVNDSIIISSNSPKTKQIIKKEGYNVYEINISEIEKAEGSLTCLSLIF